jgi:prepilin-type N-terminal cleavage/methylation domain-containing protein
MKITGINGRKSASGFTLVEMLISVSILTIVIVGTFNVFVQTIRSYNATSLMSVASKRASLALDRMVVGVGTNYGLREAQAASVVVTSSGSTSWKVAYSNQSAAFYFKYSGGTTNMIVDQSGKVICTNVVSSTAATNALGGCQISVTVAEKGGGRIMTNTMSTFVEFRN